MDLICGTCQEVPATCTSLLSDSEVNNDKLDKHTRESEQPPIRPAFHHPLAAELVRRERERGRKRHKREKTRIREYRPGTPHSLLRRQISTSAPNYLQVPLFPPHSWLPHLTEHEVTACKVTLSELLFACPVSQVHTTMDHPALPIRSSPISERNQQSRNYFTSYALPSSAEAINGPVREPIRDFAPITDRLIVGVDFGTTFSGLVDRCCIPPCLYASSHHEFKIT